MKRAVIVHGWGGTPEEGWFPWLKQELEERGFEVLVPQLPDTNTPHVTAWVSALAQAVGSADENTYLVGHSMGCPTIVRYLESLPEDVQVGGAVFVAGFFEHITGLTDPHDLAVDREWYEAPLDTDESRKHLEKSVAIFSDDDPLVAVSNAEIYKERLDSKIILMHGQRHFSGSSGCLELPVVLEELLELAR